MKIRKREKMVHEQITLTRGLKDAWTKKKPHSKENGGRGGEEGRKIEYEAWLL